MSTYIDKNSQQYFAFNIWSIESAKAVIDAASELKRDLILQTSTKAFLQLDKEEMRFFVTNYARRNGVMAYLHLDHCKKMELIQEAIHYKWDSVMIDASEQLLGENIRLTNEVCSIAKVYGIPVEAEVGQISGVEEDIQVKEAGVARIEDVKKFVAETNADMLAVAIGTAHGLYRGAPKIHFDLLEDVMQFTDKPLVIHGGTGLSDETLYRLLSYQNVKKINISTDIKLAYCNGIQESLQYGNLDKEGFDPLKVTKAINEAICDVVKGKLVLLDRKENREGIE